MLIPIAFLTTLAPQDPCFQPPQIIELEGEKTIAIAAGDLDGDGAIDLAASEHPHGLRVVLDVSCKKVVGPPIPLAGYLYDFEIGDIDGDGLLDLATADLHDGFGVRILHGDGMGGFSAETALPALGAPSPYLVALADFDADGKLDVAALNYFDEGNGLEVWLQGASGFAASPPASQTWPTAKNPNGLAVADVDDDGNLDAVVATRHGFTLETFLGDGAGGFSKPHVLILDDEAVGLDVADVDGDGKPDAVVTQPDDNQVLVFGGDGAGGFGPSSVALEMGDFPGSVSILDMNGDAMLDLVVGLGGSARSASIRLGTGDGGFGPYQLVDTGMQSANLLAQDLNGDGKPDLAAGDLHAADVSVVLAGCGPTIATVPPTTGLTPSVITISGEHLDLVTDAQIAGAPATILAQGPTFLDLQPSPTPPGFAKLELSSPLGDACAEIELWPSLRKLNEAEIGGILELEVDQGEIGIFHLAFSPALLPQAFEMPWLPATYGLWLDFLQPGFTVLPAGVIPTADGVTVPVQIPDLPSLCGKEVHVQALTWEPCFPIGCPASFSNVLTIGFADCP